MCGLVKDSTMTSTTYVVAAGGSHSSGTFLRSTELLQLDSDGTVHDRWIEGPSLPVAIVAGGAIVTPGGKDLLIMGGESNGNHQLASIYRLRCFRKSCSWNETQKKLAIPRSHFVIMSLPSSKADCE